MQFPVLNKNWKKATSSLLKGWTIHFPEFSNVRNSNVQQFEMLELAISKLPLAVVGLDHGSSRPSHRAPAGHVLREFTGILHPRAIHHVNSRGFGTPGPFTARMHMDFALKIHLLRESPSRTLVFRGRWLSPSTQKGCLNIRC